MLWREHAGSGDNLRSRGGAVSLKRFAESQPLRRTGERRTRVGRRALESSNETLTRSRTPIVVLIAETPLLRDGLLNLLQDKCRDISFFAAETEDATLQAPDLILIDAEQESVSGPWLQERMRQVAANHSSTPVLLISGLDMAAEGKRAIETGYAGFIPSTQSSDQLIAAIRVLLTGGRFYLFLDRPGEPPA